MIITQKILNGEIPATEEQLKLLDQYHEKHDLTQFSYLFFDQETLNNPIGNRDVSKGSLYEK